MAEKTTKTAKSIQGKVPPKEAISEVSPKPKKNGFKLVFKIAAFLLVFVLLAGIGFAAGVFFKIIDMQNISAQLKLNEYPVIGKYFNPPKTNFDTIDEEMQKQTSPAPDVPLALQQPTNGQQVPGTPLSGQQPNGQSIDAAELQKQIQLKQKEDAKRISKLSRLYGGMKPEEAVPILNQLDDTTVLGILGKMEEEQVSKILAQMDPQRAARLTNIMAIGPTVVNPNNNKGL